MQMGPWGCVLLHAHTPAEARELDNIDETVVIHINLIEQVRGIFLRYLQLRVGVWVCGCVRARMRARVHARMSMSMSMSMRARLLTCSRLLSFELPPRPRFCLHMRMCVLASMRSHTIKRRCDGACMRESEQV